MELERISPYSSIYQVDCFWKEFLSCIRFKEPKNPQRLKHLIKRNACIQWYYGRLDELDTYGKECAHRPKFEYLETKDGYPLYSIRSKGIPGNPRIIFTFNDDNSIILLYPFLETNDSAYALAKEKAVQRAKILNDKQ